MDGEYFIAIAGTDGKYEISNLGRVRSLYFQGAERETPIYLRPGLSNGYYTVAILMRGKITTVTLHSLVARHFIPNPNFYKEINHKDGNRSNNNISNLEWCDHQQNMRHMVDVLDKNHGSKNFFAIFTDEQVREILKMRHLEKQSAKAIAEKYNTRDTTIINICAGRRYKKEYNRFIGELTN